MTAHHHTADSPWPHRLAVMLVCATFPVIWVGGLVTTYQAGMAVPDWPTTYGYNMFLYPWETWMFGPWDLFVEHGHRLLAACAGLITIGLVAVVIRSGAPRWLRQMAWGALALVVLQGLLGGARVLMDERLMALVHGCVGPGFLAYATALAVVTSRRWRTAAELGQFQLDRLPRLAWITCGLAYAQLVLGAHVRHIRFDMSLTTFRAVALLHVLLALALTGHVAVLAVRTWRSRPPAWLRRPALLLAVLLAAQLALGVATWTVKYAWPIWLPRLPLSHHYTIQASGLTQSLIVTAHVAVGSLIVALSLLLALRVTRLLSVASPSLRTSDSQAPRRPETEHTSVQPSGMPSNMLSAECVA